jgi:hypothetical protein
VHGYDTPPVTGATVKQMPERAFYPAVPVSVVAEIEAMAKRFAATELKVAPTREDARPGKQASRHRPFGMHDSPLETDFSGCLARRGAGDRRPGMDRGAEARP